MAQQRIVWTVLPNGIQRDGEFAGRWCVSVVVSPRLTPETAHEQQLASFPEWKDWPAVIAAQGLELEVGGTSVPLIPVHADGAKPDSEVWRRLFYPRLPVAGFRFTDFSKVNLRSFPVRHVLGFVRRHYTAAAAQSGNDHPVLLPWRGADPVLKGLLGEAGTRTRTIHLGRTSIDVLEPGFGRFLAESDKGDGTRVAEAAIDARVFGPGSCIKAPIPGQGRDGRTREFALRALPPDWEDPALLRSGAIAVSNPADAERRAQVMEQFSGPAEYALWQSDRFYRRTPVTAAQRAMRRPDFSAGTTPPKPPQYDFHQRVASYADHPQLLRRLGLVIDCVLERNDAVDALLAMGVPATGTMRLRLRAAAPHDPAGDVFPATAWWASPRRFVVRPRTGDHAAGLLRLERANDRHLPLDPREGSPFDLYQLDPDGAALKTVHYVLSAQRLLGKHLALGADGEVTYTTGDRQPLAALRSGGIGVSRHGRAAPVAIDAATAALNNARISAGGAAAAQVTLWAEDVLRGYRIDIRDSADGRWRSLVAREPALAAMARRAGEGDMPIEVAPDEGYVKGASTAGTEERPDDQYLHETLFRWTGWSLAAPRPGRTIRDRQLPGSQMQVEEVVEVDDAAKNGNGLKVKVRPRRGSLPRLRFGHEYRVRARLVDLAGNSLALDDPDLGDDEQASDALVYGRFEPVDPPPLAPRRKWSEGESLERMVIRSNFDRTTTGYAADIAGGAIAPLYADPDFEYGEAAERHVVPPRAAQQQCELHGAFDFAIGQADPEVTKEAYAIAARESGTLMDAVPGAQIELATPARAASVATVSGPGALIEPPALADATKDRFAAGQYVIHREALVPVPYLPDPAAGGIALHFVPGIEALVQGKAPQWLAPGLLGVVLEPGLRAALLPARKRWVLLVDFDVDPGDDPAGDWPDDMRSLRLVLAEQPGEVDSPPCGPAHSEAAPPKWDRGERTLTIFLPKGHIARLRYASFVHDRLVGDFGLPRWQDPNGATRLRAEAMAGANWTITPWRSLTLVHATQQPVCEPALVHVSVRRQLGEPFADLQARQVLLHGPSTGQFEIVGEWHEWIDDPAADDPAAPGPRRVRHEAQLAAIRLAENHPNVFVLDDAVRAQRDFVPVGGQVDPTGLAQRPEAPGNRHEFGDTRFRFVRYRLRATTRFREYLPPALYALPERIVRDGPVVEEHRVDVRALPGLGAEKDAGAPVLASPGGALAGLMVPSSAPPAAPQVVCTVPTFRWERPAPGGGKVQSVRHGNGLRVYLERPWFSSGDGELLGVVIRGDNADIEATPPELLPFVTQWGRDPLWASDPPSTATRVADFAAAVTSQTVPLQELPGTRVVVVGHRVHFDPHRRLWVCDIELDPGAAYMPFVRLALVRYQPNALLAARISRVVLAEFAQVLPRRRAVLQRDGSTVTMRLHGPVPDRGPMRQFNSGGAAESPYADISFAPALGKVLETGRNRVELVLQVRDPALDSDLAWADHAFLGSAAVGGDAASTGGTLPIVDVRPAVLRPADTSALAIRTRFGETVRFDRLIDRGVVDGGAGAGAGSLAEAAGARRIGAVVDSIADLRPVLPWPLLDPPVWTLSTTLPELPADRPARLVVREFERFYTDRTVPEVRAGAVRRRVVIEERLVYAEVFDL